MPLIGSQRFSLSATHAIPKHSKKILVFCTHVCLHLYIMKKTASPPEVRRWFVEAIRDVWPVATGSLSLRKGRCIRPNCQACASGPGHSNYALYGRHGDRRFSIYIPGRLVPEVREAIQNGRRLQELINEVGVRYVKSLKKEQES